MEEEKQIIPVLEINTSGALSVQSNALKFKDDVIKYLGSSSAILMTTDEDFKNGKEYVKNLDEMQGVITEKKKELKNSDIIDIEQILDDVYSAISKKKTEFKNGIKSRREERQVEIIRESIGLIKQQVKIKYDVSVFREECIVLFKGKSSFDNMRLDAIKHASAISLSLKEKQERYEAVMFDIREFNSIKDITKSDNDIERYAMEFTNLGRTDEQIKEWLDLDLAQINKKIEAAAAMVKQQEANRVAENQAAIVAANKEAERKKEEGVEAARVAKEKEDLAKSLGIDGFEVKEVKEEKPESRKFEIRVGYSETVLGVAFIKVDAKNFNEAVEKVKNMNFDIDLDMDIKETDANGFEFGDDFEEVK